MLQQIPLIFLFTVLFSSLAFSQKSNPECPASGLIPESLVSPLGLKSYLSNNSGKIKSIEDVICCLPKSFRENYIIAHTSKAAQNSTFTSPRVLIFNSLADPAHGSNNTKNGEKRALHTVISINGGDGELNQANSIEMLYNNPVTKHPELFDFEHRNGKFHISGKNPESCMGCHGDGSKPGLGGPKTIFDPPFAWDRFIKGLSPCTDAERQLTYAMELASKEAFKANARFRCLDPKPDGFDPFQGGTFDGSNDSRINAVRPSFLVNTFDEAVADINDRRVSRIIQATPDYDLYKYVVLGISFSCIEPSEISSWLPLSILNTHTSQNYLLPELRNSDDLLGVASTKLRRFQSEESQLEKRQVQAAQEIKEGKRPNIEFSTRPTACRPASEVISAISENLKKKGIPFLLKKFEVDTALQGFRNSTGNPMLRFVFEGRGISMEDWGMGPTIGHYNRQHRFLPKHLINSEPTSSPLRKLQERMWNLGMIQDSERRLPAFDDGPDIQQRFAERMKQRHQICEDLKRLSNDAFAAGAKEAIKNRSVKSAN